MGFRELAHGYNKLVESHKALLKEHADTRRVLIQLIGAHNHFVNGMGGFRSRLRWIFRGAPHGAPTPAPDKTGESAE